jgi:hypothetical protein
VVIAERARRWLGLGVSTQHAQDAGLILGGFGALISHLGAVASTEERVLVA